VFTSTAWPLATEFFNVLNFHIIVACSIEEVGAGVGGLLFVCLSKKCCIEPNIVVFFFVHQIISINLMNYRKMPRTFIRITYILRFSYNFHLTFIRPPSFIMFLHIFFSFRSSIHFFSKKTAHWMQPKEKKKKTQWRENCRYRGSRV